MKTKRYFGTNFQEAFLRARLELGDDILLLNTNSIPLKKQGDQVESLTEITVSQPESNNYTDSSRANALPHPFRDYFRTEQRVNGDISRLASSDKQRPSPAKGNHILPEELIDLFDRLVQVGVRVPDADFIIKQVWLKSSGMSANSAKDFESLVKNEVINTLDQYHKIPFDQEDKARAIAFVGATGAGKTSIIMKLAAHKSWLKTRPVAIVTLDHYRIGAKPALKAFANIANIPLFEAQDVESLRFILTHLRKENRHVLIDTPGRSPLFPHFYQEMQTLLKHKDISIEIELVISAATDIEDIFLNLSLWSLLEPNGLIVTKLDETTRPGKIISLVRNYELPVHFVCDGQRISQDILPGKGSVIWGKLAKVW
jgi:flagellar biosynthesis protein FlhF